MKIGIDSRAAKWYRGTGIGTYSYQLINSLNKIDSINDYLLFTPETCKIDIPFKKNFQITSITENIRDNFWDEVNIPNILLDKSIDIYHVPQNGVGLPKDKKCPFIITLHDVIPYKMPHTVSDRYLKIFTEELPNIVKLCDGIITVSEYSKQDIIKSFNFPKEKIFVTHLASEDIYKPIDKNISNNIIKTHYSLEGDFILYIGGFSPRKNIIGLIDAFSNLLPLLSNKDIKLVIAGNKGKSFFDYKKRAEDLHIADKVIFPGFISMENMPYLYNSSKLFVYPSFYEGFGLPPIEAMSCGIPVITSNVTSIPEIVQDAALLINPNDVDDLCTQMYYALENESLRQTLITKGFNRSKELTWQKTGESTLKAYYKTSLLY